MKSHKRLLILLLIALLIGGLAWKFWPLGTLSGEKTAMPSTPTPSVPKYANATPATSAPVVSAPKLPVAQPVNPTSTANAANSAADRAAITVAGGSIAPLSVNYDNNQVTMDFGVVVFTPGLPVPLILPTGQTGTMTASIGEGGALQVDLDIKGNAPSGQSTMMHMVTFTDAKSGNVEIASAGLNFKFSPRLQGN